MRHGKTINHLSRKAGHRAALMMNLSLALIQHKRIFTTVAKAKALKKHIEPLITKSKSNTTHNRRVVFSYLSNKEAVTELVLHGGRRQWLHVQEVTPVSSGQVSVKGTVLKWL